MRKVIVSMNMTLDGYMAGPQCELDWHFRCWNEEMAMTTSELLGRADTILLGRITYDAMARYWSAKIGDLHSSREDIDFADMMNRYTKVVFSRSLTTPIWNNSRLVKGNIAKEIRLLKDQPGRDMITYGSGQIVDSLVRQKLVDEFQIWMHPVAIGRGKALFRELQHSIPLQLSQTRTFSTGVVLLFYHSIQSVS